MVRLVVTSTIVLFFALPVYFLWSDMALEERLRSSECTVLDIDSDFVLHTTSGQTSVTGAGAYIRLSLEHFVDGRSWTGEATTDKIEAGSEQNLPTYEKGDTVDCWYDPESLGGKLWLRKVSWRDQIHVHVHASLFVTLWLCSIVLLVKRRAVVSTLGKVPHAYLMAALGFVGVVLPFMPVPGISLTVRIVIFTAGFVAIFRGLKLLTLSERERDSDVSTSDRSSP